MRAIAHFLVILLAVTLLSACGNEYVRGNNKIVSNIRKTDVFNQVSVAGNYKLEVAVGLPQSITVIASSNIEPLITTTVQNGILEIRTKPGYSIYTRKPILVKINTEHLQAVTTSGSVRVWVKGIVGSAFTLQANGMTRANLAGQVDKASLFATGASQVMASNLKSNQLLVQVSGIATVYAQALQNLQVKISGAGRVLYRGTPTVTSKVITGNGKLIKENQMP